MARTTLPLLLFAAAIAAPVLAAPVPEIPFRFEDGFICIEARIDGSAEPLNLLLDSGAGASVLNLRTVRRLRIPLGAAEVVRGVDSDATAYRLASVRATAGAVALPEIQMAVDLSIADDLCSRPIDGLIGVDFFEDRVVQIDYARRRLRILPPGAAGPAAERLPIRFQNGVICLPVGVNDSKPRWTRLDTGCNDALHWVIPRPQERSLRRGVSIGFVSDTADTALTSVSLGARSLEGVKTALHGSALFPGEAGLLGNGVLSQFTVTIDWPNREVRFQDSPALKRAAMLPFTR